MKGIILSLSGLLGVAHWCAASQEPILTPLGSAAAASSSRKKPLLLNDLLDFHKNLTQIESISGNEKEVGDWLAASLESQGYHVEKQYVSKHPQERFNVLAWPGETRDAPILVTSHIDTVPPFLPYHYNKTTGLISGRGSVDDKASVAAQTIALNELLARGQIQPDDVSLLFVVGEEVGGTGMRQANALGLHPRTVIFGEPTEGKLVSGHKGIMQVGLRATGKAGHSGYPWLGRSANEVLVRALAPLITLGAALPHSDKYGATTFNLGRIAGGVAGNVIAESATADIAVRIAAGTPASVQRAITHAVHRAVAEFLDDDDGDLAPSDIIEVAFDGVGYGPVDLDHDVPGFDVITVNYGTDVPWLNRTVPNQKRYLYGPGSILVAHSANETLTVDQLRDAVAGYQKIVLHALTHTDGQREERKMDL